MKVKNETRYLTADLRHLIQAVAERELEPAQRKRLHVHVIYKRGSGCGGYAYYNSNGFTLKMPRARMSTSPAAVASTIAHEMAHAFKGLRHSQMRGTRYSWKGYREGCWDWAKDYPLGLKPEAPKKERPGVAEKLEHAQAMLEDKERQAKRVVTLIKRWKKRVRYYERSLEKAASPPPPAEG